jgi:hypothetical protein
VTRNSLVQALADSRDGDFGAGLTPPRVGEIGFEAKLPGIWLARLRRERVDERSSTSQSRYR